jgi:hypothetical protein
MYFLTACLIVVVVSAAVSLRRSRNLSQKLFQWVTPAQRLAARRRALWPAICAGFCLLVLLGFHHLQHEQELGPTTTTDLMMLTVSFIGGWFLGIIGGMD